MEIRWLVVGGDEYWSDNLCRFVRRPTERVLQYRDGVTHDAPWIDVPEAESEGDR